MATALLFSIASCKKTAQQTMEPEQQNVLTEKMMSEDGANPDEASVSNLASSQSLGVNSTERDAATGQFLYTESNEASVNNILIFKIKPDGSVVANGSAASGGAGMGMPLGSQGAIAIDKNNEWLYAVNAGSNSVSSFKIHNDGSLTLAHTTGTCGKTPVSLSVYDQLLYVLNRGSDDIRGYKIGAGGSLSPIAGSIKPLSGTAVNAPQISFTPNGDWLVVTEKATNTISTFKVKNNGSVNPAIFTSSVGATPFGFAFARGRFMIVSDAAGGAAGAGATTSYTTGNNGMQHDVNGAVPNMEAAPCWVAVTKYGRFAYVSNTASNTISSYYVAPWGALYLVHGDAAGSDMSPADIVVAANNYNVYELNTISNTIGCYHRKPFGGLQHISNTGVFSPAATGLATN